MDSKILLGTFLCIVGISAQKKCPGVFFNERYYDTEIIKDGVHNIHEMALNSINHNLYFIFDQLAKVPTKVLGYVNMDTGNSGIVTGIRDVSSLTINQDTSEIYVGGSDGLFLLRHNSPQSLRMDEPVRNIFYKDYIFYTDKSNRVFAYKNGRSNIVVPELQGVDAERIVLDDDNNIFFLQNTTKLFRVKLGTRAINSHENYDANFITVDTYHKPYILTKNGVYVYNKYKYVFDKVFKYKIDALTFNRMNEPIYSINGVIIRLKHNSIPCYEY